MRRRLLDRLLAARAAGQPVALVTDLGTGQQALVYPDAIEGETGLWDEDLALARQMLAEDRSGLVGESLFVQVNNPPLRLVVVGAVHIAQALAPLASLAGYAVTVIDPRGTFATEARFPGVALSTDWPDEALTALQPDARTAIVTLTHDPKLDDPALEAALGSAAFYIGALGSKKTHAKRLERLRSAGFQDNALSRIHGPLGLAIGAKTQAEIAVSILAQVIAARRGSLP
ncbi:MAG: xanthine dehydrogenase [Alphaproteobacteria bacterium]|nr:MAG: xanthine dehydrogenase [Alphaproteobacteria bacterium]